MTQEHATAVSPQQTTPEPSLETGETWVPTSGLPDAGSRQDIASLQLEMTHVGPLPTPEMLFRYSQTDGAAELVLEMARKEQEHRHEMQRRELDLASTDLAHKGAEWQGARDLARRGQTLGAVVCVVLLLGGLATCGLIAVYAPSVLWVGLITALLPVGALTGLVFTFMRGRHGKAEKKPALTQGTSA